MSQEPFDARLTGKMPRPRSDIAARFVRACTIEMHMDMSQKPFHAEIYWENAGRQGYHLTVRTPSVWPHCLGKNSKGIF